MRNNLRMKPSSGLLWMIIITILTYCIITGLAHSSRITRPNSIEKQRFGRCHKYLSNTTLPMSHRVDIKRLPIAKVSGGQPTSRGQFPSYVIMSFLGPAFDNPFVKVSFLCSGVLFKYDQVLTAASCLTRSGPFVLESFKIAPGNIHEKNWVKERIFTYEAKKVCLANKYSPILDPKTNSTIGFTDDYAIVNLKGKIRLSHLVDDACFITSKLNEETETQTVGIGLTETGTFPDVAHVLQSKARACKPHEKHDSHSCFTADIGNICPADPGSPIFAKREDDEWCVASLLSYGPILSLNCPIKNNVEWVGLNIPARLPDIIQLARNCRN